MVTTKEQLVLRKADYDLLISYLRGGRNSAAFDRRNAEEMEEELKKAKLVPAELFPEDVVGLNSRVTIKDEDRNAVMQYELVIPEKADIKAKRISIMAPLGTALLGFRKGRKVTWQFPAGTKTFTIMDVENQRE